MSVLGVRIINRIVVVVVNLADHGARHVGEHLEAVVGSLDRNFRGIEATGTEPVQQAVIRAGPDDVLPCLPRE